VNDADIPTDTADLKGGGTFHALSGAIPAVAFHMSQLRAQGVPLAEKTRRSSNSWEYTGFHEPFDIRGTAFIIVTTTRCALTTPGPTC
jgi:hypothetical protein